MAIPQPGIFALGTSSHAYLELDSRGGAAQELVAAVASLREPRTTIGGVNLVTGFRPELWRAVAPGDTPADVSGFTEPVAAPDGYAMPATQHDVLVWVAGTAYDVVFDVCRGAIAAVAPLASVAAEVSSWPYRHDRDLTGFEDGTENPSIAEAVAVATVPAGDPGGGGSVLLLQQWEHDADAWESLTVAEQERAMGRTKVEGAELEDKAEDSHVARTDQEDFGKIFRRNMPYGTVTNHGTMFVGFSARQDTLHRMLESMAGLDGTPRDALTRYTHALTGAYYFVPSVESVRRFCGD